MQSKVWDHWFRIENLDRYSTLTRSTLESEINNWRSDIKSPLPRDIAWYEAEVEEGDINLLYIISSDDWSDISKKSFLVTTVSGFLHSIHTNNDSIRIAENIREKIRFLESGGSFDTKFIGVSENYTSPFTLLEGNRRAVALCRLNRLVGVRIYLGISQAIKSYLWVRYTYEVT